MGIPATRKPFLPILAVWFALMMISACTASRYAVINAVSADMRRGDLVVANTVRVGRFTPAAHTRSASQTILLGSSHSDGLAIRLLTNTAQIAPDAVLVGLALNQVQQDWGRFGRKHWHKPLSIDFWLLPPEASFRHRSRTVASHTEALGLIFATTSNPDKPAIDAVAQFVDTLSHELYHVSRLQQDTDDILAEEVNAHAWGFCSKFGFALAAEVHFSVRPQVQPSWRNRMRMGDKPDTVLVNVPADARNPVKRSMFGMATFFEYLLQRLDTDRIESADPVQTETILAMCAQLESNDLRIIIEPGGNQLPTAHVPSPSPSCNPSRQRPSPCRPPTKPS